MYDATTACDFYFTEPTGWVSEVASPGEANGLWVFGNCAIPPNSPDSLGHARRWWDVPLDSFLDAWLHSPQVSLAPQAAYTLTFNYGVSSAADPSDFNAYYGDSQNSAAMTTQIFNLPNAVNTSWTTANVPFSVAGPGSYHIGLQNTDPSANEEFAAIDDIQLVGRNPLTFYNLTIEGGATTFSTDLVVENDFTVNPGGQVDFGTTQPTIEGTFTNNGSLYQTLDVPGATTTRFLHITDAAGTADKYFGVDITPAAGMGSTTVEVRGNQSGCSTNPADQFIGRCFNISPTTPGSASLRFWFTEAERNGRPANALVLWHHNGTAWELAGDSPTYSEGDTVCTSGFGLECWIQVENVTGYSPFAPGANATPTVISLRTAGIQTNPQNLPLMGTAVFLFALSALFLTRHRKTVRRR